MNAVKYYYVLSLLLTALSVGAQPVSENASSRADSSGSTPSAPKFVDPELPETMPQGNAKWKDLETSVAPSRTNSGSLSKSNKKNAADRARQFYLEHPDHPKARRARKMEIDVLFSIDDGSDSAVHPRLRTRVAEYRTDRSIPEQERAQVAKIFDLREATRNGGVELDHRKAFEQVARNIAAEFGNTEDGEEMLLSIAKQRGNKDGLKIARELARGAKTERAKTRATQLQTRLELVGQPLAKILPNVISKRGAENGLLTVIYSWSTEMPGSMATAKLLGEREPKNATWIGINLDTDSGLELARSTAKRHQFPGSQIYTVESSYKTVPRKLGMQEEGLVYLVDSEGIIFDVQVHQDLMNMIFSFGL